MVMFKTARAKITTPQTSSKQWSRTRKASSAPASLDLIARASEIFGKLFNPSDYLITHCTIVASVDTYKPKNMKFGKVNVGGTSINRRFPSFRIKPKCAQWINDNHDAWDREVLLKSYPTFIGAHNFVEHVQVEELSKGRVIDAVARDLGDTVYVDILVATDRRHKELCDDIENEKITTLSMGCTIAGSICTKCGHWAADASEACYCIKHEKGQIFFDDEGQQHTVAELCGHSSLDDHGGCQFVEGSWVGVPAFGGAVLRNILIIPTNTVPQTQMPDIPLTRDWKSSPVLTASAHHLSWGDVDEDDGESGGDEDSKDPVNPLEDLEDDLVDHMKSRVDKKLRDQMDKKDREEALGLPPSTGDNDNLIKQSNTLHHASVLKAIKACTSTSHLMDRVALLDANAKLRVDVSIYRASVRLGSTAQYSSLPEYFHACRAALGRTPTKNETETLLRLGKIIEAHEMRLNYHGV